MLTDLVMPGINGRELAAKLQRSRPEMMIFYMSGYTDHTFDNGEIDSETAFVQMPFVPDALLRKVRSVLGRSRDDT